MSPGGGGRQPARPSADARHAAPIHSPPAHWNRELRSLPVPVPRGPHVACCVLHAGSLIRRAIGRSAHHEVTQY